MASPIREVAETFGALAKGFSVTFKNMFRKTVTENYPHEPVHFQPRYRGIHVLHRDDNGLEKCIGCSLVVDPTGQTALKGPYGVDAEALLYMDVSLVPRPAQGDQWAFTWPRIHKS